MDNKPLDIQFQKRFVPNLISNVVYFVINVIIGLLLVPFFLDTLGESAYSLIPLATSLTSYVTLVIDALNTSVSRFLTVSLQRGDIQESNEVYNTSVFGTLAVVLLLVPVAIVVALFIPSIFDIGTQSATSAILLFVFIFGSILIRSWSHNFMSILFAHNRLDLRNWVNALNVLVQFVLIVILFMLFTPSLELVGISYLVAAVVALILVYSFSRKINPNLKISPSLFKLTLLSKIGYLSIWVVFNSVGALLYTNISLILANLLCGDIAGAQYAIAYAWFSVLYAIGSLVTNVFTPNIYAYYSSNDNDGLINFTKLSTKIIGIFIALPIGLVCVFASELLTLWVGEEYAFLSLLLCIIVFPVIIHIQASCSYAVYICTKNIQVPALFNFIAAGIAIILSIVLTQIFELGVYGIAVAVGLGMIFRQGVFNTIYTAYVLKAPLTTYFKSIYFGVGMLICLIIFGFVYSLLIPVDSILLLVVSGIIISILYALVILKICLNKNERVLIKNFLPEFIQKVIPSWLM